MMAKKKLIILMLTLQVLLIFSLVARADEGFYYVGSHQIDFRLAKPYNSLGNQTTFEWVDMANRKGEHYLVKKTSLLGTMDIEGILVKKSLTNPQNYRAEVYFKKTAWPKMAGLLDSIQGQWVGLVKDGKLFSVTSLANGFEFKAVLFTSLEAKDMDELLRGLTKDKMMALEDRVKQLQKTVEEEYAQYNSASSYAHLADKYLETEEFERALFFAKKANDLKPNDAEINLVLYCSYLGLNKNDDALVVLKRLLVLDSQNEVAIRLDLAELYIAKGDYKSAKSECDRVRVLAETYDDAHKQFYIDRVQKIMDDLKKRGYKI